MVEIIFYSGNIISLSTKIGGAMNYLFRKRNILFLIVLCLSAASIAKNVWVFGDSNTQGYANRKRSYVSLSTQCLQFGCTYWEGVLQEVRKKHGSDAVLVGLANFPNNPERANDGLPFCLGIW